MFCLETLVAINQRAAENAREGRPERDAMRDLGIVVPGPSTANGGEVRGTEACSCAIFRGLGVPGLCGRCMVCGAEFGEGAAERPAVYGALADHQRAESWTHRELAAELRRWADIFDSEFKLEVPEVSLRIDRLPPRRLGHFRPGHNGFGLKGEVAINELYLRRQEPHELLGTLLHELLHAWQQAHGRPGRGNYHNKEFREKARGLGLLVDERGHTRYPPEGPFWDLLARHGVRLPEQPPPPTVRESGQSKLKKWTCGCTNVRVAVAEFRAVCLRCGAEFHLAD